MERRTWTVAVVVVGMAALLSRWPITEARQAPPSDKPETPFKLMTFETDGRVRLGMVLGTRVLDIAGANRGT